MIIAQPLDGGDNPNTATGFRLADITGIVHYQSVYSSGIKYLSEQVSSQVWLLLCHPSHHTSGHLNAARDTLTHHAHIRQ